MSQERYYIADSNDSKNNDINNNSELNTGFTLKNSKLNKNYDQQLQPQLQLGSKITSDTSTSNYYLEQTTLQQQQQQQIFHQSLSLGQQFISNQFNSMSRQQQPQRSQLQHQQQQLPVFGFETSQDMFQPQLQTEPTQLHTQSQNSSVHLQQQQLQLPYFQQHAHSTPHEPSQSDQLVRLARRKRDMKKLNKKLNSVSSDVEASLGKCNISGRRSKTNSPSIATKKKQQGRPLAPKTKVRLTLSPNLTFLYSLLVTGSNRNQIRVLSKGEFTDEQIETELDRSEISGTNRFNDSPHDQSFVSSNPLAASEDKFGIAYPLKSQTVIFVEPEYATELLSKSRKSIPKNDNFPSAILVESNNIPIYDSIELAIKEIFKIDEFSLLRISRAAALEPSGAIVLKMETARPGDKHLNDDEFDIRPAGATGSVSNFEENDYNLGSPGDPFTPTFLKKKVARPRYKSDMRIYLLPRYTSAILYSHEKMLKRDLLNGTLKLETDKRIILCAFDYENVFEEVRLIKSNSDGDSSSGAGSRLQSMPPQQLQSLTAGLLPATQQQQAPLYPDYYSQLYFQDPNDSLTAQPRLQQQQITPYQAPARRSQMFYNLALPAPTLPTSASMGQRPGYRLSTSTIGSSPSSGTTTSNLTSGLLLGSHGSSVPGSLATSNTSNTSSNAATMSSSSEIRANSSNNAATTNVFYQHQYQNHSDQPNNDNIKSDADLNSITSNNNDNNSDQDPSISRSSNNILTSTATSNSITNNSNYSSGFQFGNNAISQSSLNLSSELNGFIGPSTDAVVDDGDGVAGDSFADNVDDYED